MKKFLCHLVTILIVVRFTTISYGQCPAATTYTTSTTAASCPSNGIMQFTNPADVAVSGGMGVAEAVYTLTAGPASGGYQTTGQSANRFEGLPPGTYSVTITKPNCPDVVISGVTIKTTYTPLILTALVDQVCADGGPGGTITATAMGGLSPIQYAFVKAPNANIADDLLTYGPTSATATSSFGLFQVRAKDGCGVFTTNTVDVEPNAVKAYFNPAGSAKNCDQYSITGSLNPAAGGSSLTPGPSNIYTIELFDVTSTNPCGIPSGASPFQTIQATSPADLKFDLDKIHAQVAIRTTSPCGEVEVRCYNLSNNFGPSLSRLVSPSCDQINAINGVDILLQPSRFTAPLSVTISSQATGTPVLLTDQLTNNNAKLYSVQYVAEGYSVQVEDACGQVRSFTIASPPTGASPVGVNVSTNLGCADELGAKRTNINLSGGVTGLLESGGGVLLLSGPDGPYSPGLPASGSGTSYYWNNLAPGTYTAQFSPNSNDCGPTSFSFTVPPNSLSSPGLTYNLAGSVTPLCSGNASLTTSFNYNGGTSVTYQLLDASNQVVATNTSGFFTSLVPGVYSVKASASTGCGVNLSQTQSFTLPVTDTTPHISKIVGIICESGNTSSGQAYFQFSGFTPYRLELSPTGHNAWSTIATGITSSTYAVTNLPANGTYDFRLSDNCGKSTVTTVSIRPLEAQTVENSVQPCQGQNYTLSAPDFPGATYSWIKDGNPIATSRQLIFAPFQTTDNGQYVVTITLGNGCVVRTATANLSTTKCGGALPVSLALFKGQVLNHIVQLDWVTASEKNNAYFQIERSKDLITFESLGRVAAQEGIGLTGHTYRFIDQQPYWGTSYYRLYQVDLSGTFTIYPAVAVILRSEPYRIYPNPVVDQRFRISVDEPQIAEIHLFNVDGRSMGLERSMINSNTLEVKATATLSAGVYLLVVEERGTRRTHHVVVRAD